MQPTRCFRDQVPEATDGQTRTFKNMFPMKKTYVTRINARISGKIDRYQNCTKRLESTFESIRETKEKHQKFGQKSFDKIFFC